MNSKNNVYDKTRTEGKEHLRDHVCQNGKGFRDLSLHSEDGDSFHLSESGSLQLFLQGGVSQGASQHLCSLMVKIHFSLAHGFNGSRLGRASATREDCTSTGGWFYTRRTGICMACVSQ